MKDNNRSSKVELLAPAGSFESMQAAIQGGADAVYFGVEQLNMRARSANNFTTDDLEEIAAICKKNQIKSYLTVNTILYDHDLKFMRTIIDTAKKQGIDAVIGFDHGVLSYAASIDMPLHISTQCSISNLEGVKFYSKFADVMILARELSLMQVEEIAAEIKNENITGPSGKLVELEIFAHGAMCIAISGKCNMSLHTDFASANRGACVQNCRRTYLVKDLEDGHEFELDNQYIMSPKDLCTIGFLDKIVGSGVTKIKLEGRSRGADYVIEATSCYREALDSIDDKTYSIKKVKVWEERLATVFNRGFWDGYYLGKKMSDWRTDDYGSKATKRKTYLGRGVKYFGKIKVAEFLMETKSLDIGDEILITGPTTGVVKTKVEELRVDDQKVNTVKKGDKFSLPISEKVRNSDKLYKLIEG